MRKQNNSINVFQTAKDTKDRLSKKDSLKFSKDTDGVEEKIINVYDEVEYQEILGFGGAFTEASAVTLYKMSKDKRREILNAYFNPKTGLGYTFCRTHINSCDFSLGNYAYVDDPNDEELETFDISRDKKALIPFIKEAKNIMGDGLKLFASPWSPPAWMKTTGKMNKGGKLKEEYFKLWAKYYAKYIKAYKEEGIDIWAITVQNEPKAVQTWDSCVYTAEEERDFVKNYLGPILEKEGLGHVKIMIWDHNRERIFDRAKCAFEDALASKYIWGVGFHWYSGDHFEALDAVNHMWPDKKLVFTEGCGELSKKDGVMNLSEWEIGERYGHNILGDLKNHTCAWTDWNLLLDEEGGPNHVGNYCDAPIIADTKTNIINYENSYYYIGHFSKFVPQGSIRISSTCFTEKLETVAFKTPCGEKVLIVLNRADESIKLNLRHNKMIAKSQSYAHSIMTFVF